MATTEAISNTLPLATAPTEANAFKDLFAGTIAGMAQVLTGQPVSPNHISTLPPQLASPRGGERQADNVFLFCVFFQFDIVKVRLQSSNAYSGTMNCATRILKEEGPRAFYKGELTVFEAWCLQSGA